MRWSKTKVALIDVDSKMPNLALMKISQYHKSKRDEVDWYKGMFDSPDLAYASKIFKFTPDYEYFPNCPVIKGGTGYDIGSKLPPDIEKITTLDYSLYPTCDYSIQFLSRGCIRKCPFCVVPVKEGMIHPVDPVELNPRGKHIEVLDNNFFANPEWKSAANQLITWRQPVNLHGVDVRILTDEHAYYLNKIKHLKQIHIAWDSPKVDLVPKLQEVTQWIKPYKLMCYVLIGYWSTPEEDMYRVETLSKLGIDPFVMPFDKSDIYQQRFARWVNHKAVFRSVDWANYAN